MAIWFTGDWYLGSPAIIGERHRPFKTVIEMDDAIIKSFHSLVENGDSVWFLGNFCYGGEKAVNYYHNRINPNYNKDIKIYFLRGQSDATTKEFALTFDKFFPPYMEIVADKTDITLCNYPLKTWKNAEYGAIHLHSYHPRHKPFLNDLALDVSVDANNFSPISWESVKHRLEHSRKRKDRRKNKNGIDILDGVPLQERGAYNGPTLFGYKREHLL